MGEKVSVYFWVYPRRRFARSFPFRGDLKHKSGTVRLRSGKHSQLHTSELAVRPPLIPLACVCTVRPIHQVTSFYYWPTSLRVADYLPAGLRLCWLRLAFFLGLALRLAVLARCDGLLLRHPLTLVVVAHAVSGTASYLYALFSDGPTHDAALHRESRSAERTRRQAAVTGVVRRADPSPRNLP